MESSSSERIKQYTIDENNSALLKLKKNPSDASEVLEFKFITKRQISPDTFIYTYELPNDHNLGLNLGQHIAIDAVIQQEGFEPEEVCRKYTPISTIFENGKFELLIKVYLKDVHPKFPLGGKMSQYLNNLAIGESIKVRGPFGKLTYFGDGAFKILTKFKPLTYHEKVYKKIGMIAGGTGITPFYQILQAADRNRDISEFSLVFANRSSKDILLKEDLEKFVQDKNFSFKVFFTIDQTEENWRGGVGHINKDMIASNSPAASDDTLMLMCGPPVMCQKVILPILTELGHKKGDIFEF